MKYSVLSSSMTETGKVRRVNQDAVLSRIENDMALFCVADGLGGHANGELASGMLIKSIDDWVNDIRGWKPEEYIDRFENAIQQANRQIYEQLNTVETCGTTLVALMIRNTDYVLFTCGDSRIYLHRGVTFQQMSRDDVWQNQPGATEGLTPEEIVRHPAYDKLVTAVGIEEHCSVNVSSGSLRPGDCFILCSDGVYKMLSDTCLRIYTSFFYSGDQNRLDLALRRISEGVEKAGAPDNYSAIIVKVRK